MANELSPLCDYADREFDGDSFNGLPLMKTLEGLPLDAVLYSETHEGYSVWEIAVHTLYYKYFMTEKLGAADPLERYPYEKRDFVPVPASPGESDWRELLAYLRTTHRVCMGAIRAMEPAKLEEQVPGWGISFSAGAAWLCGHDTYHIAQIRNMGVPGLRADKEG